MHGRPYLEAHKIKHGSTCEGVRASSLAGTVMPSVTENQAPMVPKLRYTNDVVIHVCVCNISIDTCSCSGLRFLVYPLSVYLIFKLMKINNVFLTGIAHVFIREYIIELILIRALSTTLLFLKVSPKFISIIQFDIEFSRTRLIIIMSF